MRPLAFLVAGAIIALNACGGDGGDNGRVTPTPQDLMQASAWEIGPVIDGVSKSPGMPRTPTQEAQGWSFDFPQQPGSVHYVTTQTGSLTGKKLIRLKFRIEGPPESQIWGASCPAGSPSYLTLYFQRDGDDWSGKDRYEAFRWWATFAKVGPLVVGTGDQEAVAPLDGDWTAVETSHRATNEAGFLAAEADAKRIGFTFSNCTGFGHGAYAIGPAKFIVTGFSIE